MKSLVVLFFGMLFWTQQAVAVHADVSFFTRRGEPFQIVLDGRLVNRVVTDQVHLQDLPGGFHVAEVRMPDRFGALVTRTRFYLEPGFKTDFMIQVAGNRPRILINKVREYPLAGLMRPLPLPDPRSGYGDPYYRDDYRSEVMSLAEMDRLVRALEARPFDDEKLSLARQVLGQNSFLAEDLKRVLLLFSFDNRKLELAKFLYPNVFDKRNFYLVYDAFRFSSDRRELERYVERLPR